MQLDFFMSETEILKEEVSKQRQSLDNVRRGLFARFNEMGKEMLKLRQEIDKVKSYVAYKEPVQFELVLFEKEKVS